MKLLKKILSEKYKRGIKEKLGVPSLHWSLENLKRKNFNPSVVIDIGAYEGNWTKDLLEVFPSARILMIEAQKNKEPILKHIAQNNKNIDYVIALVSTKEGEAISFIEDETASHVTKLHGTDDPHFTLYSHTVDSLLQEKGFPFPQFLKLDVQGHELEVLKGAEKSLSHAEVCLLEVSLMDIGDKPPLLIDVLNFMDKQDYQAYDISQFIRRPYDKALWQVDMFFVKKSSSLIAEKRWA